MVGKTMTIEFKTGNILNAEENMICQSVNHRETMGGGLALQIRKRWPNIYKEYCEFSRLYTFEQIRITGIYHCFFTNEYPMECIINIFGQDGFGNDKRYTDYISLENSFKYLHANLKNMGNKSLGIPSFIGCGLGGGDWDNVVYPMIVEIFGKSEVKVVIYKLEGVE